MEKRINIKLQEYIESFKNDLMSIITTQDINSPTIDNYIKGYKTLQLEKDDFIRRKRVKNIVPYYERCNAKRANNERCTRRKKDDCLFCGTHNKGQPHGVVNNENENNEKVVKKIVVKVQDIKGIIYYLDEFNNVYDPNDILNNIKNPKIIAKYQLNEDGTYSIPEFEI